MDSEAGISTSVQCEQCGRIMKSEDHLKKHVKTHDDTERFEIRNFLITIFFLQKPRMYYL